MTATTVHVRDLRVSHVTALIDALHDATPRARTRRCDAADARLLIQSIERAQLAASEDDIHARVIVHADFVANSYRGSAESDRLEASLDLRTGEVTVTASRTHAQRRAGGTGNRAVVCLRREGQVQGRYI